MFSFHWSLFIWTLAFRVNPSWAHMSRCVCPGRPCGFCHNGRSSQHTLDGCTFLSPLLWLWVFFWLVSKLTSVTPNSRLLLLLLPQVTLQVGPVAPTSTHFIESTCLSAKVMTVLHHQICPLLMFKLTYLFPVSVAFLLFSPTLLPAFCFSEFYGCENWWVPCFCFSHLHSRCLLPS